MSDRVQSPPQPPGSPAVGPGAALPAWVRGIDAEALFFFRTLYQTGSLPKAADQMGVSLSSANRMLAALRRYWNDPLFRRSGFMMQPTPAARNRYSTVLGILRALEDLQSADAADFRSIRKTIRVACYDNAFAIGIASLFPAFSGFLPNVTFQVTQADEHLFDSLREDRLDLAFFARQGLHPDLHSAPAITTPYACITAKGHPLAGRCAQGLLLTKHDLAPYRQVLVNTQPDRYRPPNGPANGYFNPNDPSRIAMVMPFFLAVPLCVKNSDFYAIVPEMTARMAFNADELEILPLAPDVPKLSISLAWHERTHADPASQYIRSVILDLLRRSSEKYSGAASA